MSTKSEAGHATNVINLEKMVAYCIGFGPAYQPSKSSIQVAALQALLLNCRMNMAMVTDRLNAFNLAKNNRIATFKKLVPLTNRIIYTLMASDESDKTKEDARGIVRKIKGIRSGKKADGSSKNESMLSATMEAATTESTNDAEPRSRSAAQTSRDQRIEHFALLLALLQTAIGYSPNEPELQIGALQQFLEEMRMTHSAYIMAEVELSNARIQRNTVLYGDKTGLCDVSKDVKFYVQGAFKRDSPQYKQISGLKFIKYKK